MSGTPKTGQYVLLERVGMGGMAEVFRAASVGVEGFERPVAIKRIAGHLLENEDMVRRFKREAQVLAKVGHPNVVGVIECEEFLDGSGEKHLLLIMELIEGGRSLKAHLGKPIDWRLATTVIRMCAEGLAAAFEQQVVHRDIKPDNIMMTRKGIAKLVDFGLAKAAESTALTMQAAPMGTPLFMSPEACRGEEVGHAGDLYSLGVSWWYMLTGKYPFDAANLHGLLYKHISEPLPQATGLFDHVPAPIVKLVYQCLEKDAANRPASAVKLVEAIESLPGQGLLMPRDARELIGVGVGSTHIGGGTTAATVVAGAVDRSAATIVNGSKAQEATAPTSMASNLMTMGADLSPAGAVAATVVSNLGPQGSVATTQSAPAATGGKSGLIVGVVIAVLALGGAGAWLATRGSAAAPASAKPLVAEPSVPTPAQQPDPPVGKAVVVVAPLPQAAASQAVATSPQVAPAAVPPQTAPPEVAKLADPPKAAEQPEPMVAKEPAPIEPAKPVVAEPPKPVVAEPQKPVDLPKPVASAPVVDTKAFDTALAASDWKTARTAADALPEPAKSDATAKLAKAADQRLIGTMRAAKKQYEAQQFQDSFATLAADVPVTAYASKSIRDQYIKLANLVRDAAKQAQENP